MTTAVEILRAWSGLFGSPVITELTPGRVWEVTAERGDRYVLKRVSTFNTTDPVRRFAGEARILAYLAQRGIPVAVPVLSGEGRVCATDDAGAPYAVFPMLPNDGAAGMHALHSVRLENLGAAVARMHAALAGCPFGVESWEVDSALLTALGEMVGNRLPAAAAAELSARLRPRWDSMVRAVSMTPQRIHGDVHGGNILTDGQRVTGIIDCDHLPMAPRAYDLGYYLAFAVQWRLTHRRPQPIDEEMPFITRHLLTGYHRVSPLTPQENEGVPALALTAALGLVDYFLRDHDLVEDSWLRTAHWIGDNFDLLKASATVLDETADGSALTFR